MARSDFDKFPKFSELPVRPGAPPESNWGVFGDDDQVGCLNFLTPKGIVEAARLVKEGKAFRLDNQVNYADPPLGGRATSRQSVANYEHLGILAFDDVLDNYNTQEGSQWDGLKHVGHMRLQAFYNGATVEDVKQNRKLGIEHWKNRIIGRGLLIDAYRYCTEAGRSINPLAPEKYTLDELKGALKAQGSRLKPGTVVLVRTGWMPAYLNSSAEVKQSMGSLEGVRACGLDNSRELVEWLWNNRVAAIGSDTFAVEAYPFDFHDEGTLHIRALPLMGLSLGEQFNLEELAADCAQDKRYEFMLVSVPLHVIGGYASPPNAVAIK
jgi:kynurenine formamidase